MTFNPAFLTAQWKELTLLNFALEPDFLSSLLPAGLVPDLWEGSAYASLVTFDFESIRVAGVPWPGYRQFPELNLRVYVRCEEAGRRGIFFVSELIPSRLPAWVAQWAYNEPYSACPLVRQHFTNPDGSQTQHTTWVWHDKVNKIAIRVGPGTSSSVDGGPGDWFKEQQWGFGLGRNGELLRYQVTHPKWLLRDVHELTFEVDWLSLYGPIWAKELGRAQPSSVFHAIGSEVAVYPPLVTARPHFS